MKNDWISLVESILKNTFNNAYAGKDTKKLNKIFNELIKYYFFI